MANLSYILHSEHHEKFVFIWLDSLVHSSQENIDTKPLFEKNFHSIKTFDNTNKFLEYLDILTNEHIILIVSGRLGQEITPIIHEMSLLIAIYVYCSDKKRNEEWAKNYLKIRGVISDLNELIKTIQTDLIKRNEYKIDQLSSIYISFLKTENLNEENKKSILFQLLIDCLSRMESNSEIKNQFFSICKKEYPNHLNFITEFEKNYSSDNILWWFTKDTFISQILNKAYKNENIEFLYSFHFILHDIKRKLKENPYPTYIRTYRAQLLSNKQLDLFKNSIGEFISMNTFLLTIPDYDQALLILQNSEVLNGFNRVLFEIHAKPESFDYKPFNDITLLNYFTGIDTILFMFGTIFHLIDIRKENNITIIQMEISNDELQTIYEYFNINWYNKETNLISFASLLYKMKKFDLAEKCYNQILEEMPNDYHSSVYCYQQLATIAMEKQDYNLSLKLYKKALDIDRLILRSEDPEIATDYNNIANVFIKRKEFNEAIDLFNQALQIWIKALGKDHQKVEICYENIATAYELQRKYSDAIDYYQKTLIIRERLLPSNHLDLAKSHNYIANAYRLMNNIEQALKHYKLALEIMKNSNLTKYSDMIITMKNISLAYESMDDFNQALVELEKIASLYRQMSPLDHLKLSEIMDDMDRISSKIDQQQTIII